MNKHGYCNPNMVFQHKNPLITLYQKSKQKLKYV
jgi:hypothetical protein